MSRAAAHGAGAIGDDELAPIFAALDGRPLALAVSGGADSMALMHLVARWFRLANAAHPLGLDAVPPGQPTGDWISATAGDPGLRPPVVVLTVDHGLREGAARDAEFVRASAQRLGFPCTVLRWTGDKPVTGLQDAARNARRMLMFGVIDRETAAIEAVVGRPAAARVLVMAHHIEDQAETVLMRLGRGSGLDGLKGMAAEAPGLARCDGARGPDLSIARPLLGLPKRRLVETLEAAGATWVEDPSNEDVRFERVRIRQALAILADLGIGAGMIALSARRLADAAEWIEHGAHNPDPAAERFVRSVDWHAGVYAELALPDTAGFEVPRYAAIRTLRQALRSFGGEGREPELQQLEAVVASIRANYAALPGDMTLGGCRLVFVARAAGGRSLLIFREGAGAHSPVADCMPGSAVRWDGGRYTIDVDRGATPGCVVRALGLQGWAELKRQVPALAALGWPAAAAATLPAIEADGRLVAYPGVAAAISGLVSAGDDVDVGWRKSGLGQDGLFAARFCRARW